MRVEVGEWGVGLKGYYLFRLKLVGPESARQEPGKEAARCITLLLWYGNCGVTVVVDSTPGCFEVTACL